MPRLASVTGKVLSAIGSAPGIATFTLLHTLDNPNAYGTSAGDQFGYSVDISGNYAIVGAYFEDDAGGTNSGKAYIFDVTTGALVHTLNNPNAYSTSASDLFGFSVAISNNYAIVGAYREDDAGGTQSGKAYIFDVTTGTLVATLDNPNAYGTSLDDGFGNSVSISGNYAIVGASGEDESSANTFDAGKAYIFKTTTGDWTDTALVYTLSNPNPYGLSLYDQFGSAVAISDNYAIIGALGEDDADGTSSGKAYIHSNTTGSLVHTLDNPNPFGSSSGDQFGRAIAVSDSRIIVGAPHEDDGGVGLGTQGGTGSQSGKAYIYSTANGSLLFTLNNPNAYSTSEADWFGWSVAISSNYAIVGARNEDDAGGSTSGKVYIYNVTTGALLHTLDNPNAYSTSASDYFGDSVAVSGNYVVVGAWQEDEVGGTNSGKAYIFNATTGALAYTLDNPNIYGTSTNDYFGSVVAIDGNYVIVIAREADNDGTASAGRIYVYNMTSFPPAPATITKDDFINNGYFILDNPNPYSTSLNDYFGFSAAISGNYAIVGASGEDDASGFNSGKAYIFNVTTGALVHTLNNPNAYGTIQDDGFGDSVAISGNYAIVSATDEDDAGGTSSGKAYIFDVTTGALVHTLDNPNAYSTSAGDVFGFSVGISKNCAVVSAYLEGDSTGLESGKAYMFTLK